ncbi:hypothetical protein Bbelb_005100 [Branchiostoma belcheri]|nr:hypothetical protein Bbelb_005100 [Branchiostoma belcheri]
MPDVRSSNFVQSSDAASFPSNVLKDASIAALVALQGDEAISYPTSSHGDCDAHITGQSSGFVHSPNHPEQYDNNLFCTWIIEVNTGEGVKMTPVTFSLEEDYDWLDVYMGDIDNVTMLGSYTGQNIAEELFVTYKMAHLVLSTDRSNTDDGFKIHFEGYCIIMKRILVMILVAMAAVRCKEITDERKVIIVGAGIAGIAAAKTLHENGVDDFVILEGSDRIGGRMKQVEFGGVKVEIGANWVQGLGNNPIWELAQRYNFSGKVSNYDDVIIRNKTGSDVTEQAEGAWERLGTAQESLKALRKKIRENKLPDVSMRVALKLGGWKPKTPVEKAIEYFDYEFEYADPPEVTSLNNTGRNSEDFTDEDYFLTDQRGFGHIVDRLSSEFLSPNDTRRQLNKVVQTVNWTDAGVTITTADGSTYRGEYGLMTVSVGVLENEVIDFTPDLPSWKVEEIYQFRMGQYCKIFLKFPRKFWDSSEFILYAGSLWPQYAIWQNLEAPGIFPNGTNILLVTAVASEVQRIELQSDEATKQEVMAVLRNMYGNNIPEPEGILVPRWLTNPLFFGAYSNWPIHVTARDFEKLAAPVGRLYFGGEATHPRYNGYVQGGYLSGIDQANAILKCMQKGICQSYRPGVSKGTSVAPAVFAVLLLLLLAAILVVYGYI